MSSLRAALVRPSVFSPLLRRPITTRTISSQVFPCPLTTSLDQKRPAAFPSSLVDNAPGWNEDLATTSEAVVKADRDTTSLDVKAMQQKTVDHVQAHRYDGPASSDPEVEPTHAPYAREEVGGPLGSAGMGEFEGVVGDDDLGPDDAQIEADGRVVTRRITHEQTTVRGGTAGV